MWYESISPVAVLVVFGLIGFYFLTYTMNKRTPVPEECKDLLDNASCKSCSNFTCSHKG